jgi:hypothetical protein
MSMPEYGVKYTCDSFPDTVFMRNEPLTAPENTFLFIKYTTDTKQYKGSVFVTKEFFNDQFKELPQ